MFGCSGVCGSAPGQSYREFSKGRIAVSTAHLPVLSRDKKKPPTASKKGIRCVAEAGGHCITPKKELMNLYNDHPNLFRMSNLHLETLDFVANNSECAKY